MAYGAWNNYGRRDIANAPNPNPSSEQIPLHILREIQSNDESYGQDLGYDVPPIQFRQDSVGDAYRRTMTGGSDGATLPPGTGPGFDYPEYGDRVNSPAPDGQRNHGRVGGKGGAHGYQPPNLVSSGYGANNMGMASSGKGGGQRFGGVPSGGKGGQMMGQPYGGSPYMRRNQVGGKGGGMARQQMGGRGFPQQGKGGMQRPSPYGGKGMQRGGKGGQMMRQPYGGSPYGGKGMQRDSNAMQTSRHRPMYQNWSDLGPSQQSFMQRFVHG